ncbi:CARDB domain-containing protein [Croceibacter atlanticus]|uniref:CARDB domain-containing protein n=1 Tax=Croceibacter atlanticus TaxID=313588 RepID=UPI00235498FA|nr:CARDB domain-containing protein [Croceibacter atlanticus]|tara:strand:+ start:85 stop:522 length:438 start_codon:yes stop_codon:yes gene_type:complete
MNYTLKSIYKILTIVTLALFGFTTQAQADLTINGYLESGDEVANAGDRISLEYVMRNLGNYDVEDPVVSFYLSEDPIVGGNDYFLESEDGSDLEAYEVEDESEQVPLPYNIPRGQYYVLLVIDPYDYVSERNEGNNVEAVPITIQ